MSAAPAVTETDATNETVATVAATPGAVDEALTEADAVVADADAALQDVDAALAEADAATNG